MKDSIETKIKKSAASKLRIKNNPNSLPKNKNRVHEGVQLKNIQLAAKNRIGKLIWINNGEFETQHNREEQLPEGFVVGRLCPIFKGKTHSLESKNKIREKILGDICYNNGSVNIKIKEGDPIPDGFKKGMIQSHDKFRWINNGEIEKKFFFEREEKIPDGWKVGRIFRKRNTN